MAGYRIVGRLKGKKYISRVYSTEEAAIKAGYKKVYRKDGNTRRKNGLHSWYVEKVETMAKAPRMSQNVRKGSREVNINNQNTAGVFESRLYVNRGETATLTHATHKTLAGAVRWAYKVLNR